MSPTMTPGVRFNTTPTWRDHWQLVIVLASLAMIDIVAIDLYLPAFPQIARTLAAKPSQVQATLSVFVFGMAIGQLVYGPVLDRYGRRKPLLAGVALFAAGSLLAAVAPTIEVLLSARLIQAIGAAAGVVAPRAIVTDLFSEDEAAAIYSVQGQIHMLAPVVAPGLGALILQWSGWRACFWLLLFITLVIWAGSHRIVPESLHPSKRTALSLKSVTLGYVGLLRNPAYVLFTLAGALLFGGLFTYLSVSPFVLMTGFGFSSMQFGLIFGGISLLIILAGALNIRLLPSQGPRVLLLVGMGIHCLAGLVLYLLALTQPRAWVFVAALACCIGALGLVFGNLVALTMARAGPQNGVASALMGAVQYAGAAMVGWAVSWVDTTAVVLAAALFVCALCAWALSTAAARIRFDSPAERICP